MLFFTFVTAIVGIAAIAVVMYRFGYDIGRDDGWFAGYEARKSNAEEAARIDAEEEEERQLVASRKWAEAAEERLAELERTTKQCSVNS